MMQLVSVKNCFANGFLEHKTFKVCKTPCIVTSSAATSQDSSTRRNVMIGVASAAALVFSTTFFKIEPAMARTSAKRDVKPETLEKMKDELEEVKKKHGKKEAFLAGDTILA